MSDPSVPPRGVTGAKKLLRPWPLPSTLPSSERERVSFANEVFSLPPSLLATVALPLPRRELAVGLPPLALPVSESGAPSPPDGPLLKVPLPKDFERLLSILLRPPCKGGRLSDGSTPPDCRASGICAERGTCAEAGRACTCACDPVAGAFHPLRRICIPLTWGPHRLFGVVCCAGWQPKRLGVQAWDDASHSTTAL